MVDKHAFNTAAGTIFVPYGSREGGARVDFREDIRFANLIEWHGVRWAWTRGTICPCKGLNKQTAQIDPSCKVCNALGWVPFQTPGYFIDQAKVGVLNEEQTELVRRNKAMVIRGFASGIGEQPNMFSVLGNWAQGSTMITFRPENRVGYYDRLCCLDDVAVFSELVDIGADDVIRTRYPVAALNALMSLTTAYGEKDVWLDKGDLRWAPGKRPAAGTRVSVHYLYHPVFVVIEFPHLIRSTPYRAKLPRSQQVTPAGETMYLPIQVVARLEHLALEVPGA